jgi:hypothetical protein
LSDIRSTTRRLTLADRFGIPPFSVLNAREGWWQNRKRAWIDLGGRAVDEALLRDLGGATLLPGFTDGHVHVGGRLRGRSPLPSQNPKGLGAPLVCALWRSRIVCVRVQNLVSFIFAGVWCGSHSTCFSPSLWSAVLGLLSFSGDAVDSPANHPTSIPQFRNCAT